MIAIPPPPSGFMRCGRRSGGPAPASTNDTRRRVPATSHFRFPKTLQNPGRGTRKSIKIRDQQNIRNRDPPRLSVQPVPALSAYAYQEATSLPLANTGCDSGYLPHKINPNFRGLLASLTKVSVHNKRSRVEATIGRTKQVIGDRLQARRDGRRTTEVRVAVHVLNRMLELGRPISVRIS